MGHRREVKKQKRAKTPPVAPKPEDNGDFKRWTFCDWVQSNGTTRNVIKEWMDGLPIEDKQAINTRLLMMTKMQRWPDTWASSYRGRPGIYELRMNMNDTPYRPLGCYGPETKRWHFTILVGAIEEEGKIALHLQRYAIERKRKLTPGCICEHEYN